MEKVVIIGASGHGIVIADILKASPDFEVVGFIDSFKDQGTKVFDLEILGNEDSLVRLNQEFGIQSGIIGIGDNHTRKQISDKILAAIPSFRFINAIHKSAVIADSVRLGSGIAIMGGTVINPGACLEDHIIVNTKASIGHHSIIKNFASIAPGVTIGGNVSLGTGSGLSIGTIVANNIAIGDNSLVGAGSLVLRDLPDHVFAYGSPAKTVGRRNIGDPSL